MEFVICGIGNEPERIPFASLERGGATLNGCAPFHLRGVHISGLAQTPGLRFCMSARPARFYFNSVAGTRTMMAVPCFGTDTHSQVPPILARLDFFARKAPAVILDFQQHHVVAQGQVDADGFGAGVFLNVGGGFLHNAEQV